MVLCKFSYYRINSMNEKYPKAGQGKEEILEISDFHIIDKTLQRLKDLCIQEGGVGSCTQ